MGLRPEDFESFLLGYYGVGWCSCKQYNLDISIFYPYFSPMVLDEIGFKLLTLCLQPKNGGLNEAGKNRQNPSTETDKKNR